MSRRQVDSRLESELSAVAERSGCELLHVELAGNTLRLILDRAEGVTLKDCEVVSRQASAMLDAIDFGTSRYVLEVSSPGLDRQLYRPRDYERFAGRRVRVTWHEPPDGRKRTDVGQLAQFEGDSQSGGRIVLLANTGEHHEISLSDIDVARLELET